MSRPLLVAALVSTGLGAAKLVAALATGSNALLASAVDSLTDAVVSGVNHGLARYAARPADEGHPFGHGKAEALAGLGQVLALTGGVVWIVVAAAGSLSEPGTPTAVPALVALLVSLVVSAWISRYLRRSAGSLIVEADSVHYRMDAAAGVAAAVGLGIVAVTGWTPADALASLVVAALIAREALRLGRRVVGELMDVPLPAEERERIEALLQRPGILGWHHLRTRRAGPTRFVELHLELPEEITLREAHALAHQVQDAIRAALPGTEALVHLDVSRDDA